MEEMEIPVYDSIERAIDAAWALAAYGGWHRREALSNGGRGKGR
jgi:acyl-CoA synthetase (NDP forming)